ncbi:DUF2784 domain-containing protein [Zavarzinella formosa]|uniref:DUF2784 domain-containing protein n=1 Tax=Zavarzinella formosa TaxID=360055 RepID=UPI0002DCE9AB|nr:DUF2784 domain-containing protein [Zavarzinella formosa]
MYGFLADLMVAIHVGYVGYVVLGQLVIWLGWALGWGGIRNVWFRLSHLAAIGFVAFEEAIQMRCPLTDWEEHFRELAGQPVSGETFVGRLMHSLIFVQFEESWPYTVIHLGFAALVFGTFILCPPRFRRCPSASQASPAVG